MKTVYMIKYPKTAITITLFGQEREIPFSQVYDGAIGVVPVFETREAALTAVNGDETKVVELLMEENQCAIKI